MSYNNDKRELLKLKQGLIEDSEIIQKEEVEKVELHGKKKFENFWYHYKIHVLMVLFFGFFAGYFSIEILTRKRADIEFLMLASNEYTAALVFNFSSDISEAVVAFTPGFNENRYIHAEGLPVDLFNVFDHNANMAVQTKLFTQVRTGITRLIIGNREAFDRIIGETHHEIDSIFVNLTGLYPDNGNITENVFFKLQGSELSRLAGIEEFCPDDFYIALLALNLETVKQQREHERSLIVLDNIVNNRVIN
ncbi:MAG: hypothetical protein LBC86_07220 [Oscillospiraceae bacterium]|jgi:hypothetical protein|nr:hypothetical protein [Oscillospiraceae bacterium]